MLQHKGEHTYKALCGDGTLQVLLPEILQFMTKCRQGIMDAHDNIDRKSEEIEKKLLESRLGQTIRKTFGDEEQQGRVEGKSIDSETLGLSVREETAWERRMRKIRESTFMGPLVTSAESFVEAAAEASERAGDRVFGENETSMSIGEVKRDDPSFNLARFLKQLETETIPMVLTAFLSNDIKPLEVRVSFCLVDIHTCSSTDSLLCVRAHACIFVP